MTAPTIDHLADDIRMVVAELDRHGAARRPEVTAAAQRLRDAVDPTLTGDPSLSDPAADLPGAHHGRETERAAAWAAFPKSGTSRIRVLHCIAFAGNYGRTDQELEERLGLPRPTAGNRRGELVKGGWVRDSGERRPTRAGNPAVVWVLTDAGQAAYRDRRGITR